MWVWRKLASSKWSDAWEERLRHVPPERVVIVQPSNAKMLRLEAYVDREREALELKRLFGGTVERTARVFHPPEPPERILSFGNKLAIASSEKAAAKAAAKNPGAHVLMIPAAMAFGTGDHATTAMCLRMLVRYAPTAAPWNMADLGTGTGIFALAARKLGAKEVLGLDNDEHAVRTAKANAKENKVRGILWQQADLLRWKPSSVYDLVTANLFSNLLVQSAPKIRRMLKPGGILIASGLLRDQAPEVIDAITAAGLRIVEQKSRGKWTALAAQRPPK